MGLLMKKLALGIVALLLLFGCTERPQSEEEIKKEIEEWHENRLASLKSPQGWLKLAGLFWLDEGSQTFGAGEEANLVFPDGSINEIAGSITLEGELITIEPSDDVEFYADGNLVTSPLYFHRDESPEFSYGRLTWTFLSRDELTGLRLYDEQSYVYTSFAGIERFPVDLNYRVEAVLRPHAEPTSIPVVNILGQTNFNDSPGILEFNLKGEQYQLTAIDSGERLFLIIGDLTNRSSTFQGGRFLYVDNPGPNVTVIVDFNMAYNPPCAFSDYTTCPIPPPENRLDVAIEAGEKRYITAE